MTLKFPLMICALAGLTACDQPLANSQTPNDLVTAAGVDQAASRLPITPFTAIPNGNATYNGHVRSSAIIEGESGFNLLADLNMNIDLGGTNLITGDITEINVFNAGSSDIASQKLDGALSITGISNLGAINAAATGDVGIQLPEEAFQSRTLMVVDLDGSIRTDTAVGDTIFGVATGSSIAPPVNGFDMTLTGGVFTGERQN